MKKPTVWGGVVVALLASLAGAIGFFALSFLFTEEMAIRLVISGLAFFYSLYLLSRSGERIGRITVILRGGTEKLNSRLSGRPATVECPEGR